MQDVENTPGMGEGQVDDTTATEGSEDEGMENDDNQPEVPSEDTEDT